MASKQKLELTWLGKDKEKSNCKNDPDTENS